MLYHSCSLDHFFSFVSQVLPSLSFACVIMPSLSLAIVILALVSVLSASPHHHDKKRGFTLHQTAAKPSTPGLKQLRRAHQKYDVTPSIAFREADSGHGSMTAANLGFYQIDIGGQTVNMMVDTGSSDL